MIFLKNFKIRIKLFILLFLSIAISTGIASSLFYNRIKKILVNHIDKNLNERARNIANLIQSNLHTATRSYLKATAIHVKQTLTRLQKWSPTSYARRIAARFLLTQKIGKTGYIYCINSKGRMLVHPRKSMLQEDISQFRFTRKQLKTREGYLTYSWKYQGEKRKRHIALYRVHFKPWDWIIAVSAYQNEFSHLLDRSSFRKQALSTTFGKSGYSVLLDRKGKIIFHPYFSRDDPAARNPTGWQIVKKILQKKSGKITYMWKNPGEQHPRKKLLIYSTIEPLGWIIASTGYLDEFDTPLQKAKEILLLIAAASIMIALLFSILFSSYITTPIQSLINRFQRGSRGELGLRMPINSKDEFGQMAWYFNLFMEREESFRELKKVAEIDRLTSLFNRRKTQEYLNHEFARYTRYKRPFSIVFGDIDHFKEINDTYGHDYGDFVLKAIADLFLNAFRAQDIIGRWGGEEFLILLPETRKEGAILVAERARKELEKQKFSYNEISIRITATFGIVSISEGDDLPGLIQKADQAMYNGKNSGKNRCVFLG